MISGNIQLGLNDYEAAIAQYKRGLDKLHNYTGAINTLSRSAIREEKIQTDQFRNAIKAYSTRSLEAKFLNNMGNTLNKIGDYEVAQTVLERSIRLNPSPFALNNLALSFKSLGKVDEALQFLHRALEGLPHSPSIHYNLAELYVLKGSVEKAIDYFTNSLALDETNISAKYRLTHLNGCGLRSAPEEYITKLFDKYSETFEKHLVNKLGYDLHLRIKGYIEGRSFKSVLDLGCGTGLSGLSLSNNFKEMIGVDLSLRMLAKAGEKRIYTNLIHGEILSYLRNCKSKFDLVMAADVLIYIGEIEHLFALIRKVLKKNGTFIFSVELSKNQELKTSISGRFAHSFSYIQRIANTSGLDIEAKQEIPLRKEHKEWIKGILFILKKGPKS